MKKLFIVALLGFIFLSCDQITDAFLTEQALGHDLYYMEEWEELETYEDIGDWISEHIAYRADFIYEWSNPRTTINRGYGDCNDICLVFANMAYYVLGIKMDLVVVLQESMEWEAPQYYIEEGGFVDHVMLRYNGQVYNYYGKTYTGPVGYYYTFSQCFGR